MSESSHPFSSVSKRTMKFIRKTEIIVLFIFLFFNFIKFSAAYNETHVETPPRAVDDFPSDFLTSE